MALLPAMPIIVALLLFFGYQSLPSPHLPKSQALTVRAKSLPAQTGKLAIALDGQKKLHPSLSGYYPIISGADAFAARAVLSDLAQHTIDIQYYIWHNDAAGQMMLKDLWQAAERGVVVRLLLDDFNNTPMLDQVLWRFSSHPNIQVRLINPAKYRHMRAIDFILRTTQMNARMHNKSMTYDNNISIIGGRNIGNEYLNNDSQNHFADLDVLLVGEVVSNIDQSFENYWDSEYSFDIETLVHPDSVSKTMPQMGGFVKTLDQITPPPSSLITKIKQSLRLHSNTQHSTLKGDVGTIGMHNADADDFDIAHDLSDKNANSEQQNYADVLRTLTLRRYRRAIADSRIGENLLDKNIPFRWAHMHFLADDVHKLGGKSNSNQDVVVTLAQQFGRPKRAFYAISSYFVPTEEGTQLLSNLAKSGVDVRILTNSYDATDVGVVHAGYAHHREALLQAKVRLFELRATAHTADQKNRLRRTKHNSTTSLHAKSFALDGDKVFIGSYNMDPRSANLNTELGVLIVDERLGEQLGNALGDALRQEAYELVLGDNGIEWHTTINEKEVILYQEPNTTAKNRLSVWLLSQLPIDWLL